jgi:HD-GYP domain-containing protein (c-di-GMP phosphodiesterase class II)
MNKEWKDAVVEDDLVSGSHDSGLGDVQVYRSAHGERLLPPNVGGGLLRSGTGTRPSSILNKPGRLTTKEWTTMKRHPQAGVRLLREIEFPWDIRPMVRHHHEHWDGGGYPDSSVGDDIPLSARILCLADVFDALTSSRSYRGGLTPSRALSAMREDCGRILDPALFELFENLYAPAAATRLPSC